MASTLSSESIGQSITQCGVCPQYGVQLSSVPPLQWAGLLVRPIDLPSIDPGSYAVSGPNIKGLCANSPVPETMAERLPKELRQGEYGTASYLTYVQFRYGTRVKLIVDHKAPINPNTPLVTAVRISRHRSAANVSNYSKSEV